VRKLRRNCYKQRPLKQGFWYLQHLSKRNPRCQFKSNQWCQYMGHYTWSNGHCIYRTIYRCQMESWGRRCGIGQ